MLLRNAIRVVLRGSDSPTPWTDPLELTFVISPVLTLCKSNFTASLPGSSRTSWPVTAWVDSVELARQSCRPYYNYHSPKKLLI